MESNESQKSGPETQNTSTVGVYETPPSETPPTEPSLDVVSPPAVPPFAPVLLPAPSEPSFAQKWTNRAQAWYAANPQRALMIGGVVLLLILSFIIRAPSPHVALSGEVLTPGGWFTNSLLTTLIVDAILLIVAFLATRRMALIPSGLQNAMEALLEYLYGLAESVAGKAASRYFPWAATIFLFVLVSNYSGLIPGVGPIGFYHTEAEHSMGLEGRLAMANGALMLAEEGEAKFIPLFRAPSADLNMTFALALATMVMVQYHGIRALGAGYFRKFWNTSGTGFMKGINIFVGILEAISELSRILSFAFRLFGNIFAGEVVLATMAFLVTFLVPIPFYMLELLVGAVQALVFAMLSLVFFTMATISHGHDDHGEHAAAHH
jgi:F-type H+-transporting ATPase subunit a